VLFGANGAGKTTLLRILSTQMRPDEGTISVAGYDRRRQPEAIRRHLGMVGHRHFLYEDLTCRENLVFYGRLFRVGDPQRRAQVVLARVGLESRADQRVRTLSHGMQKRLAIGRAILHQPALLLLDEPEAGLDRESLAMLHHLVSEWTGAGGTVLMTTHNVELGLAWADKVAVLSGGRISFQQPKEQLDVDGFRQRMAAPLETIR
jgi:heme ABC exporter ATP-binding subunit CcmA